MKILDVRWFCSRTNVGIVRVQHEYDGIMYYVAAIEGLSETEDAEFIAAWGSRFPKEAGDVLFGVDDLRNGDAVPVPLNRDHAAAMARVGLHYLENTK